METFEVLMSKELVYLALGLTAIMLLVGRVKLSKTKQINQTKVWQWFGTLIVLVAGVGVALIPGLTPDESTLGQKILFGAIAAAFASTGRDGLKAPLFNRLEGRGK
jgi:hypothetical protein